MESKVESDGVRIQTYNEDAASAKSCALNAAVRREHFYLYMYMCIDH